jgi:OOP family OmpA-OmpF porin
MLSPKKILLALLVTGVLVAIANHFNLLPSSIVRESAVPDAVQLSDAPEAESTGGPVSAVALPSSKPVAVRSPQIRLNIWAWNAQMGLLFANGGPSTTQGSLMEKNGVNLKIARQDDTNKSQELQIQFANALAAGEKNPNVGVHYVIIMGDQAAGYLEKSNKLLEKLGDDYRAEIIGAVGYSRGEDAWWGPQEWKDDPASVKGKGTAGVLREGDWNITLFKLANDGIKNNPDETTWDMDAHNWFAAADYLKAVEMYVSGYCEDRPVVKNGRKTGDTHRACVEGVTTWTPGDVNLAKQKGGLVRILSTAENVYQMPSVVIGIRKWNNDNAKVVSGFLNAALAGGDQVKHHESALSKAGQISYNVYGEQSAAYWVKYYKGVVERDKTGIPVPLGGSTTMNLGDNLVLFGLADGAGGLGSSVFRASYEGFGKLIVQQYPDLMDKFPPITQAVNTRFLQELAAKQVDAADTAETVEFTPTSGGTAAENVVATRNWNIQFDTGQASFGDAANATLTELYNQLVVGGALTVEIQGHTDNVGNPASNMALSRQRAAAVKSWLEVKAPRLFPENRVTVTAHGDTQPVASNATAEGKARNRRVTIILGNRQ